MADVNQEMAKLYMEAVALVIKLSNKIRQEEVPGTELHLAAAREFLERNQLYVRGGEGWLK